MALHISPARLRDELTELCIRVSAGEYLLAAGVHQAPVLIRPLRRGDRGRHTSLTHFRRELHRTLREAAQEPIIVTVSGIPTDESQVACHRRSAGRIVSPVRDDRRTEVQGSGLTPCRAG